MPRSAYSIEDNSVLSRRMIAALLPPYFKKPQPIAESDIDHALDTARYTFVIVIPPHFERDVVAGRQPAGPGECRCDRHGPGRARLRLSPADPDDGGRKFRLAQ